MADLEWKTRVALVKGIRTENINMMSRNRSNNNVENGNGIANDQDIANDLDSGNGFFGTVLTFLSIILLFITLPFSLIVMIKTVQEYERAVIFRLGRIKKGRAVGPGLFIIIPCIDNVRVVDLRHGCQMAIAGF